MPWKTKSSRSTTLNTSSPASAFAKVLRSFETGGFTYRDVVAELKRLLKAGASPTELSEILRRRELVEPLPVEARKEVLSLLDSAKERTAAPAADPHAASADASSDPHDGSVVARAIALART